MTKKANLFMLFLLCFNLLIVTSIGTLYWEFFHGTVMGTIIRSPWWLIANQVIGLLVPMFIFRALGVSAQGLRPWGALPFTSPRKGRKGPVDLFGLLDLFFIFINVILVIAITLLLQPAMMLVAAFTSLFLPNPVTYLISELAVLPVPMALIIVALTPAICEEWVFRGYILDLYSEKNIAVAAVVNGLFFGIIHLNLHQFAYAFIMGIVFVYMVYITRSLFYAILSHFVVNAFQYILGYMAVRYAGAAYGQPGNGDLLGVIIQLGLLVFFTLPLVAGLFYVLVKHNARRYNISEEVL